ncbi:MAG: hypothetical protein JWO83_65 [Caulobacteraceae bacterium]|nr:hypothetical protein [Caulobacteraceae bacterium]
MTKTITKLFDNYAEAQKAVEDLRAFGILDSDISVVASAPADVRDRAGDPALARDRDVGDRDVRADERASEAGHDASKGAGIGGLLGGVGGLAAGVGLLAIPGLGPVVAAGWLVSTAVGAAAGAAAGGAAGGIIGALTHAGVSEEDAHVYAESVRRGGAVVSVRVDDSKSNEVESILNAANTVDVTQRRSAYRAEGWSAFDATAPVTGRDFDSDRVGDRRLG